MLVYSGGLTLQISTTPLRALVKSILAQAQLEGVSCEVNIAESIELEADPQRLQQVFINLIDNAVAFSRNQPDGKLCIEASMNTDCVVINVHNNGPKIDNSLQGEALFQPFMTKRAGGSGLGLAIVRRIVDAHGGHIQHRADTDWPVTFELTLPQHSAHSRLGNPSHDAT
jgi:signal transduction histidine kinase